MTNLKHGEYAMYTSKQGIEYHVQNVNGNLLACKPAQNLAIVKPTKEIQKLFKAM